MPGEDEKESKRDLTSELPSSSAEAEGKQGSARLETYLSRHVSASPPSCPLPTPLQSLSSRISPSTGEAVPRCWEMVP